MSSTSTARGAQHAQDCADKAAEYAEKARDAERNVAEQPAVTDGHSYKEMLLHPEVPAPTPAPKPALEPSAYEDDKGQPDTVGARLLADMAEREAKERPAQPETLSYKEKLLQPGDEPMPLLVDGLPANDPNAPLPRGLPAEALVGKDGAQQKAGEQDSAEAAVAPIDDAQSEPVVPGAVFVDELPVTAVVPADGEPVKAAEAAAAAEEDKQAEQLQPPPPPQQQQQQQLDGDDFQMVNADDAAAAPTEGDKPAVAPPAAKPKQPLGRHENVGPGVTAPQGPGRGSSLPAPDADESAKPGLTVLGEGSPAKQLPQLLGAESLNTLAEKAQAVAATVADNVSAAASAAVAPLTESEPHAAAGGGAATTQAPEAEPAAERPHSAHLPGPVGGLVGMLGHMVDAAKQALTISEAEARGEDLASITDQKTDQPYEPVNAPPIVM